MWEPVHCRDLESLVPRPPHDYLPTGSVFVAQLELGHQPGGGSSPLLMPG